MTGTRNLTAAYAKIADHRYSVLGQNDAQVQKFRQDWLPETVSQQEFTRFEQTPTSYLIALYPRLYVQGPNADTLARVTAKIESFLQDVDKTDGDKQDFALRLWQTYDNIWGHLEDVGEWDVLHAYCEQIGLGDLLLVTTPITKPDADHLYELLMPYLGITAGGRAVSVVMPKALDVFTQMILLRSLVDPLQLTYDQVDDDNDWGYEDSEYADPVTYAAPLLSTWKSFQRHDEFMQNWGLS